MELWQLNIAVVGFIALITRKDMAVIAFSIMSLAWLVTTQGYTLREEYFYFCVLNALFAILAASYNHVKKCNLSVVVASLASIACIVDLIQMYNEVAAISFITSYLGWGLATVLLLMDGSKGLLNGLIRDGAASYRSIVHIISRNLHNKGHH